MSIHQMAPQMGVTSMIPQQGVALMNQSGQMPQQGFTLYHVSRIPFEHGCYCFKGGEDIISFMGRDCS